MPGQMILQGAENQACQDCLSRAQVGMWKRVVTVVRLEARNHPGDAGEVAAINPVLSAFMNVVVL